MQGIPRLEYLATAAKLTSVDRDKEYGPPHANLTDCAMLWTAYLQAKFIDCNCVLTAEDVAWLNVLQKIGRTFSGQPKPDTYIDAAAYSAIAGECAQEDAQ